MHPLRLFAGLCCLSLTPLATGQISCVPPAAEARFLAEETTVDSIGYRFGISEGAMGYVPGVSAGFAFRFDGVDDYVHAPDELLWDLGLGGGDFTLELWAKFDSATAADPLLAHSAGAGPGNKWIFQKNRGGQDLAFVMEGSTQQTLSVPATWSADRWYHLALVRQGNAWTFYRDGVALGTVNAAVSVPNNSAELWIGGSGDPSSLCRAAVDDVWFWSRGLPASEVAEQFRHQGRRCVFLSLGRGCTLPAFQPTMSAPLEPRIGQMFMLDFADMQPNAGGALFLGGSSTSWANVPLPIPLDALGLTTCRLMVAVDLVFPLGPACGCQHTVWLCPIPMAPELVGVELYFQAVFTDAGANPAGLVATNAGRGAIGQ